MDDPVHDSCAEGRRQARAPSFADCIPCLPRVRRRVPRCLGGLAFSRVDAAEIRRTSPVLGCECGDRAAFPRHPRSRMARSSHVESRTGSERPHLCDRPWVRTQVCRFAVGANRLPQRQRLFHSRAVSPLIDLPRRYRHRHVTKTGPARHAFAGLAPVLSWCRTDSVPLVRFSTLSHRWYMERSTRMRLKMKTSLQNLFKHKHALVALAVVLA